jgi:heterodisulfide reductase subunit A
MNPETKTVAIIGAGPAGIEAAAILDRMGYYVVLLEKEQEIGGHLRKWDHLFPSIRKSDEVLDHLLARLDGNTAVLKGASIQEIKVNDGFDILLDQPGNSFHADAVLIATGFDVFDAHRKEEYGYGIYDHVITSADLEYMFAQHQLPKRRNGEDLNRIAFIHCVGSRDEKVGVRHCSKVCCVTAVKQAIEMKQQLPDAEIFLFYMDMRMFGLGYEELYKEAQEKYGIRFIRGRLSESFENQDGSVMVKVEDTLAAKPLRLNVDLMVLMVGMLPASSTAQLSTMFGLDLNPNGFFKPADEHYSAQLSGVQGVFLAGACKAPKNVEETLADARAAALQIDEYFKQKHHG